MIVYGGAVSYARDRRRKLRRRPSGVSYESIARLHGFVQRFVAARAGDVFVAPLGTPPDGDGWRHIGTAEGVSWAPSGR